jgi:hypothetical protein
MARVPHGSDRDFPISPNIRDADDLAGIPVRVELLEPYDDATRESSAGSQVGQWPRSGSDDKLWPASGGVQRMRQNPGCESQIQVARLFLLPEPR